MSFWWVRALRRMVVFGLLLMAGGAFAEPVSLTAIPHGSLGLHASVLQEQAQPLTLAQARARQQAGEFRPGKSPVLSFGIGPRPVWVHLALDNPTQQALPFRLVLGTTWIDQLDVHIVHNGQVTVWQTGDSHPHAPGLTFAEGFVFSPVLEPGRSELYVRAQTEDPLLLPIELLPAEQAAEGVSALHYSYGFVYGFLAALAIYNGVLYAGFRKRSYLYYALYLTCFIFLNIAYTGHGYAWWWSEHPGFQRYIILALMVLFCCVGLAFASSFLALKEHAPKALCWVRRFALTGLGLFVLSWAFDSQYGAALVAFSFGMLFMLVMVILGLLTVRRRLAAGYYFLAATVAGILGTSTTTITVWGGLPFNSLTYHGSEIGLMLEAILLALALAAQMRQSDEARQNAEQLARIDVLTGLHNRRAFFDLALPTLSSAERKDRLSSLIMLDVDHFKQINDQHGHGVGDYVLIEVARLLRQICRAGDILARWGGEEFVMLLPETSLDQAIILAERIRQQMATTRLPVKNKHIAFTASLGVAEHDRQTSLETLINEADMRLYAAKKNGRNQVSAKPVGQSS